jgi:hypothetical protein
VGKRGNGSEIERKSLLELIQMHSRSSRCRRAAGFSGAVIPAGEFTVPPLCLRLGFGEFTVPPLCLAKLALPVTVQRETM